MKKVELEKELERLTNENKKLRKLVDVGQRFSNLAYSYTQHIRNDDPVYDLKRSLKYLLVVWDKTKGI